MERRRGKGKLPTLMKLILLSFLAVVLLIQSGCANRPSLEEQNNQVQKQEETARQSDAFAKQLAQ